MQFAKVGAVISGIAENITHTHSILTQELMGRLELQFNGIPLLLGYIPVNREPRWGLLNGQLLMADVNTTDSRAKSFKRGVCTGSFESSLSPENLPGPRTPSPGYGIGREKRK